MKIEVSNLSFKITEKDLRKLFEKYGEVKSVKLVMDLVRGRSKGHGVIEMVNDKEGEAAIDKLNGYELDNRPMIVRVMKSERTDSASEGERTIKGRKTDRRFGRGFRHGQGSGGKHFTGTRGDR